MLLHYLRNVRFANIYGLASRHTTPNAQHRTVLTLVPDAIEPYDHKPSVDQNDLLVAIHRFVAYRRFAAILYLQRIRPIVMRKVHKKSFWLV